MTSEVYMKWLSKLEPCIRKNKRLCFGEHKICSRGTYFTPRALGKYLHGQDKDLWY